MPSKSAKQRAYIYAAAGRGEKWAVKFIRDSGHSPPPIRKGARKSPLKKILGKR